MVQTLSYDAKLTVAEAERIYQEVEKEFGEVKENYSGLFSRFKRNLKEEDRKTLTELVGVLLPLSMQPAVASGGVTNVSPRQVNETMTAILLYSARFKNSGIKVLEGSPF